MPSSLRRKRVSIVSLSKRMKVPSNKPKGDLLNNNINIYIIRTVHNIFILYCILYMYVHNNIYIINNMRLNTD